MDITASDIATGRYSFSDIHPDTCSDVDLRNAKANALFATAPWKTETERNEACSAFTNLLQKIGARGQWQQAFIFDLAMDTINWAIAVHKADAAEEI